ncbi:MAG: DUF4011 domain-containing protein [Tannerellaceae bacterium]|nr:DUF4011 domain-containing protein [Tannerellaceae bacterium]
MANINIKIEAWKKRLLDLGKRNRLLNFRETKRSNVTITYPELQELYTAIVSEEKTLSFPHAGMIDIDEQTEEIFGDIHTGDLQTNRTFTDLQRTLKILRAKSKSTIEEQGINTLYLAFGFLKWTESKNSEQLLSSPIILVPVTLTIESITSPYKLHLHEDEIVLNPTLVYRLENDFGIQLPEFDSNETDIEEYLNKIASQIKSEKWEIEKIVNLTTLSFLKINMYKDLERNQDRIIENPVSSAIAGDGSILSYPKELENYDHDRKTRPVHTFQVMDADSSQQDAILLSKKGVSFVLQGPPGTGKSQTITNIISEALSDGKKVLFVAEKMAALQVVHKRLKDAGLSDFCLTLHNHKANKKEILQDLAATLSLDKKRVREEAIEQLNTLEATRNKLNQYHEQLHTTCQPSNRSIYEVNGKLAALQTVPNLIFDISNPGQTTPDQLNNVTYLLNQYAATIGKMSEDFRQNPWYNSIIPSVTHELRHDIATRFPQLLSHIKELIKESKEILSQFNTPFDITINRIDDLISIINFAGKSPSFPAHWLGQDLSLFTEETKEFRKLWKENQTAKDELVRNYREELLQTDAIEEEKNLQAILQEINGLLNNDYSSPTHNTAAEIQEIYKNICNLLTTAIQMDEYEKEINQLLDIQELSAPIKIKPSKKLLNALFIKPVPTAIWFDFTHQNAFTAYYKEATDIHTQLIRETAEVESAYDKDILTIDFNSILKRFRTEYRSFLKALKPQYKKDKKLIHGFARYPEKLTDEAITRLLQSLKSIAEKQQWIKNNEQKLNGYFGLYYIGTDTKWDEIQTAWEHFQEIKTHFNHLIPETLKTHLLNNTLPVEKIIRINENLKNIDEEKFTYTLIGLSSNCGFEEKEFPTIIQWLEQVKAKIENLLSLYDKWKRLSKQELGYESFRKDLTSLKSVQENIQRLEKGKEKLTAQYGSLYNGAETDWTTILDKTNFAIELIQLARDYNLPADFVKKTADDTQHIQEVKERAAKLSQLRENSKQLYNWATSLFAPEENFDRQTLFKLQEQWENCANKQASLEEWIDYRNNREACKQAGLETYIRKVEELKPDAGKIRDIYLKRFYKLWLDAILPDYPAVSQFRRNTQEEMIREFKKLDTIQQKIARSRVRESLLNKLPDFNTITSSKDEVGLLKRELNKQRKLLPLRKLFNQIPNLLMTLKPCCMMSPLSVSVFLEARSYEFDLIIFDEASQGMYRKRNWSHHAGKTNNHRRR